MVEIPSESPYTDTGAVLVIPMSPAPQAPRPCPEQRLMAAVLEDAIHELQLSRRTRIRGWRRRAEHEAVRWFASRDQWWPYSFENICDALGLDASATRRRLGIAVGARLVSAPRRWD